MQDFPKNIFVCILYKTTYYLFITLHLPIPCHSKWFSTMHNKIGSYITLQYFPTSPKIFIRRKKLLFFIMCNGKRNKIGSHIVQGDNDWSKVFAYCLVYKSLCEPKWVATFHLSLDILIFGFESNQQQKIVKIEVCGKNVQF